MAYRIRLHHDEELCLFVHLFNAVIDLCVQRLNKNIRFYLGGEVNSYMAFADDMVLMAKTNRG